MSKEKHETKDIALLNESHITSFCDDENSASEIYKFLDSLIKDSENFSYVKQLLENYPTLVNIKKSPDDYLITKIVRKYINLSVDNIDNFRISHYCHVIDLFVSNPNFNVPKSVIDNLIYEFNYNLTKSKSIDFDIDNEKGKDIKRIVFNLEEGINLLTNDKNKKSEEKDDEKLTYKYHIESGFSKEALEDFNNYISVDDCDYLDKTEECIITIDSSLSHFYEDACSIKKLANGNYLVGVYVVDVDKFISVGSKLHEEAFLKGENLYVKDKIKCHMLPETLRKTVCSLEEGLNRYAIGYLFEFSETEESVKLENFNACHAIVKIKKNLSHKDFSACLKSSKNNEINNMANLLYEFTKKLNKSNLYDNFEFNGDGFSKITKDDVGVPSIIVRMLNTLTNIKVAEFFKEKNIPFIYSSCPRSENTKIISDIKNKVKPNSLFADFIEKCTKLYGRPKLTTKPEEFYPLNVPCYTTMTSPARRYVDLINEDRVKKFLIDKKKYDYNYKDDLIYLNGVCDYLNGRINLNNNYKNDYIEMKKTGITKSSKVK